MFLIEPYPIVEDSNLAKAISVSLLVGQTGLPNLTQKRMNCLMLLLLFLLVPSAYIMAWESCAFLRRALNWSSTVVSLAAEGAGMRGEDAIVLAGGGGCGGGPVCDGAAGLTVLLIGISWPGRG